MYEIYAYGNNESLFGIFNAMAAIMGGSSYLSAIALVAVCGFCAAAIAYAFAPERMIGWKWLASVIIVFSVLFVPKVTVGIVDKLGTQPVKVVSNVPFGAAIFGHITSSVGNILTELFETAFQTIPDPFAPLSADLTYQKHGMMFGNRLIKESRNIVFRDPEFRTDLVNFVHNCTMYDLMDGTINPGDFSRSTDVWPLMGNPNPARFSTITSAGTVNNEPCPTVYQNLNQRIPAQVQFILDRLAVQLNPSLDAAAAASAIAGQLQQAYLRAQLGGAALAAAEIIRQNAVINAIQDSSEIIGQKINDPASLMLGAARAQATAATNASWIIFGRMAEEALPLIRNAIEAIIYALFPFIILLLMMTHGAGTLLALKSYVLTLAWIQLWPPIYAILNYMATLASAKNISAAADLGLGLKGMALQSASVIYSNAISDQAVVGYLVLSVPAIAWAALKGMETIGQAAITGVSSIQSAASSYGAQAASGNLSMGNTSFDQLRLAPVTSSAYMNYFQNDKTGDNYAVSMQPGGQLTVEQRRSMGVISAVQSASAAAQVSEKAEREFSAGRNDAISAATETIAALAEGVSRGRDRLDTTQLTQSYSAGEAADIQHNYSEVRGIVEDYSRRTGLDKRIAAALLFSAGAQLGGNVAESAAQGGGSEVGTLTGSRRGGSIGLGGSLGGRLTQDYSSKIGREYSELTGALSQEQAAKLNMFAKRFATDEAFRNAVTSSERDAEDISSRLQTANTYANRAEARFHQGVEYEEEASRTRSQQATVQADYLSLPWNTDQLEAITSELASRRGGPAQNQVIIDNALAQISAFKRPSRYASGEMAHWGEEAVRGAYRDFASSADLSNRGRENYGEWKRELGAKIDTIQAPQRLVSGIEAQFEATRENVEAAANRNSSGFGEAKSNFETGAGLVNTTPEFDSEGVGNPDGELRTRRSLANDTKDMFVQDVKQSGENLAEGVTSTVQDAKNAGQRAWEWLKGLRK